MNKSALTTGQVAKYCNVTVHTVINWIGKGLLVAHQLPGKRGDNRIQPHDLLAFMQENDLPIPPDLLASTPKKSVMIVDDDPQMIKALRRVLRGLDINIATASNGFEAGLRFAEVKPQLVILDLQMPKMDGFSVLELISATPGCEVIVISGMGEEHLERARQLGARYALSKQFSNDDLLTHARLILCC